LQDVAEGRIRNSDASVHRFVIFFSCLYTTQIIVSNFFFTLLFARIEISTQKAVLGGKNFVEAFTSLVPPIYAYGHTDTRISLIIFMKKHEFLSEA